MFEKASYNIIEQLIIYIYNIYIIIYLYKFTQYGYFE